MNLKNKISIALESSLRFFIVSLDKNTEIKFDDIFDYSYNIINFDGGEIDAENSSDLINELGRKSLKKDIIIIDRFDDLNVIVQNKLLKSLEEIGEDKIIFALVNSFNRVIDTIRSRAYILDYNGLSNTNTFSYKNSSYKSLLKEVKVNNKTIDLLTYDCSFFDRSSVQKINNIITEHNIRVESNCNNELCFDLLCYKILEDRWK